MAANKQPFISGVHMERPQSCCCPLKNCLNLTFLNPHKSSHTSPLYLAPLFKTAQWTKTQASFSSFINAVTFIYTDPEVRIQKGCRTAHLLPAVQTL